MGFGAPLFLLPLLQPEARVGVRGFGAPLFLPPLPQPGARVGVVGFAVPLFLPPLPQPGGEGWGGGGQTSAQAAFYGSIRDCAGRQIPATWQPSGVFR